jgi:UDP-GlcNAc:undecaprenyl-phosphate/decaprenyl-phosphate GlcNAc-1-phosphate transferase
VLFIGSIIGTLLLSVALTLAVRRIAVRKGIVAAPRKDRWHQKPTAMLGGIAIYLAFVAGYLLFAPTLPQFYPILIAGTLLFVVGLLDDIYQLKPYTKLIAQVIVAAGTVYFGARLTLTDSQVINDFITIFWLVGITNAINLLDNMDGLSGGVSVISCIFLAVTFFIGGQTGEMMLPVLLGSAALGFLVFNFNPATIFMGDCGSMFLGFMLGGTALLSYGRLRNVTAVLLTPVLILLIPIFDTCMVTVTRKLSGRPVSQGGRDHTSHRLVAMGMSERRAVIMLYFLAALSGTLAMMVRFVSPSITLIIVPAFVLVMLFIGLYLGKVKVYDEGEQLEGNMLIRVVADFSYKRRVFEVMLDLVLVALAYYGAYLLRFDADIPEQQLAIFIKTLPLLMLIQMSMFWLGGVYRGLWRYTGVDDLITIAKSVLAYAVISAVVVFGMYNMRGPSRAVFILNALLLFLFVGASRLFFRLLPALVLGHKHNISPDARPVLIYGAGDGGALLIREILNNPIHHYMPVGFIDDDDRKAGKLMHGYRIFNSLELPNLMARHNVNEVLISSEKVSEVRLTTLRNQGLCLRRMTIRIE